MAYSKIILTVRSQYRLEMNVINLDYGQQLRRVESLNKALKLGLRKVAKQPRPMWARRIGDKWRWKTRLELI